MARNLVNKMSTKELIDLLETLPDDAGVIVEITQGGEVNRIIVDDSQG